MYQNGTTHRPRILLGNLWETIAPTWAIQSRLQLLVSLLDFRSFNNESTFPQQFGNWKYYGDDFTGPPLKSPGEFWLNTHCCLKHSYHRPVTWIIAFLHEMGKGRQSKVTHSDSVLKRNASDLLLDSTLTLLEFILNKHFIPWLSLVVCTSACTLPEYWGDTFLQIGWKTKVMKHVYPERADIFFPKEA